MFLYLEVDIIKYSSNFYHFICGKLLGDGCITKQEGRKPRFQFMHRPEDLGWVEHSIEN